MAGGAVFKLGSFGNFGVFKKGLMATEAQSHRGGVMRANWGMATRRPSHLVHGGFRPGEGRRWP